MLDQLHSLRLFHVRVCSQMLGLSPRWRPHLWCFSTQVFDTPSSPRFPSAAPRVTSLSTPSTLPFQSEPMVAEVESGVQSSNVTLKNNKAVSGGLDIRHVNSFVREELDIRHINCFVARGFKPDTRCLCWCAQRSSTHHIACIRFFRDFEPPHRLHLLLLGRYREARRERCRDSPWAPHHPSSSALSHTCSAPPR